MVIISPVLQELTELNDVRRDLSMTPIGLSGWGKARCQQWIAAVEKRMPGISQCMKLDFSQKLCWIHDYVSSSKLPTMKFRPPLTPGCCILCFGRRPSHPAGTRRCNPGQLRQHPILHHDRISGHERSACRGRHRGPQRLLL
jgi:hypothetical protein